VKFHIRAYKSCAKNFYGEWLVKLLYDKNAKAVQYTDAKEEDGGGKGEGGKEGG